MSEVSVPAELPLHFQPLTELSRRLRAGTLSPVELTEHFLARIEALDGKLGAFRLVLRERALAQGPCQTQVEMSASRPSRNVRFVAVEATRPLARLPAPVRDAAAPSLEA